MTEQERSGNTVTTEDPTPKGEETMNTAEDEFYVPDDSHFTITDTDEPVDVTPTNRCRRKWPVITAVLTAALALGGGGLIAYSHHRAAERESLVQVHETPPDMPTDFDDCVKSGKPAMDCIPPQPHPPGSYGEDEPGHVWGTQPGESGGNLSDLQDGACPSHMTEYPNGKCVPESERKSRASEFIPDPASCESGVIVLNPTPRCETKREKTADAFRQAIEQARQENNPPLHRLTDGLSPAARAATQG